MNNQKLYKLVAWYEDLGLTHEEAVSRAMSEYVAVKKLLARDAGADLTKAAGVACCGAEA